MIATRLIAVVLLLCFALCSSPGQAGKGPATRPSSRTAGAAQTPQLVTLTGYVVDAMCGRSIAKRGNPMERAARHTRDCSLDEGCAASGYGIFAEGQWYKFDPPGDGLAKAAIEKSARKDSLAFEVTGSALGGEFAVASVKEISLSLKKPVDSSREKEK